MFNLISPLKMISVVLMLFGFGAIAAIYTLEKTQFSCSESVSNGNDISFDV